MGMPMDKMSSAIYFTGTNMTPERVMNITSGAQNRQFKRPRLRNAWVKLLNSNTHDSNLTLAEQDEILRWADSTIIPQPIYDRLTMN